MNRSLIERRYHVSLAVVALAMACVSAQAQFQSGSTGANGPFPPSALPNGTTTITLDLRNGVCTYLPGGETAVLPNTPANGIADGVLHFTDVVVPENVTWNFVRNSANSPLTILAQTTVSVAGALDVSGVPGGNGSLNGNSGGGGGGPGGFKGGNGEALNGSAGAGNGLGPGGGFGGGSSTSNSDGGGGGSYATSGGGSSGATPAGATYGQPSLLPLIGGSGGGGGPAADNAGNVGGGGGGGGGAVLVAATTSVAVDGSVLANGGLAGARGGGGGSGGAIRIISETITGSGTISAVGGGGRINFFSTADSGGGGLGRIRLEATFNQFAGTIGGFMTTAGPGIVQLPTLPTIRITTVGGQAIAENPTGGFGGTDVSIAEPGVTTVAVSTTNVPAGTTVSVTAKPEQDGLQIGPVISPALVGDLNAATTSVDLTFPTPGLYFIEARATFTTE